MCSLSPHSPHHPCAAYASISPPKWIVSLSYKSAEGLSTPVPCGNITASGICIPTGEPLPNVNIPEKNSVVITYRLNTTAVPNYTNTSSTITLKGCYSDVSSVDRPWRKAGPIIGKDKQCSIKVTSGLAPVQLEDGNWGGEYTYTPGQGTGPAFYTVEAVEVCEDGLFCAFGKATGYYSITPIDDLPSWLVGTSIGLMFLGPLVLIGYFVVERRMKKNK
jgi:High-affinity nitrate transporter accessory